MLRIADDPLDAKPSAFSLSLCRPLPSSLLLFRDKDSPGREGIMDVIFDIYCTPLLKLFDLEDPLTEGGRESTRTALRISWFASNSSCVIDFVCDGELSAGEVGSKPSSSSAVGLRDFWNFLKFTGFSDILQHVPPDFGSVRSRWSTAVPHRASRAQRSFHIQSSNPKTSSKMSFATCSCHPSFLNLGRGLHKSAIQTLLLGPLWPHSAPFLQ